MGLMLGMTGIGQMLFMRQALAERTQEAARWGAVNPFDAAAIRNMVLYGAVKPSAGETPFAGMSESEIVVGNPGCPGADCRVSVAIPGQGIQAAEPVEAF
jgi:hypothetical protein